MAGRRASHADQRDDKPEAAKRGMQNPVKNPVKIYRKLR